MNNSEERMATEKLSKLIISLGVPTLIAQVINLLYNIVDRIYIGHIPNGGSLALTGVGITMPVIMLISAFSVLVGAGGAPLAAIALGQGNKKQAKTIVSNSFVLLLCISATLMIIFYSIENPFLHLVGASENTYPFATAYLNIYLVGTFFVQLVLGLNPYIAAQGQAKVAMISVGIGAILNIVLDPIFIFVFAMGVRGAALATVISQFVSAIWVIRFLTSDKATLRIDKECLRLDPKLIAGVLALGISPFIMQSTESLIMVVLNSGLQKYGGDLYVGSLTILQSVMQLIVIPISGFTQGVQPIVSYNFGAGNLDRVKRTYRAIIAITTGVSFFITLFMMILPGVFANLFTNNAELSQLVIKVLPIFMAGMLIFGLQMGCQNVFIGLGQAKISLFIALLRKVLLLVPFAIVFPMITNNVYSIYYAECTADIMAATICGIIFATNIKKILRNGPKTLKKS